MIPWSGAHSTTTTTIALGALYQALSVTGLISSLPSSVVAAYPHVHLEHADNHLFSYESAFDFSLALPFSLK